jgi:carbonic anhydrase/acetyltransferase-like protein (isoleucine patch superfamily)
MIIPSPHDPTKVPKISSDAFVAETAVVIGDVTIETGANIWYGAILRGDVCSIHVGKNSSIQDNAVLHAEIGTTCVVEDHCIIAHHAMVHGPCNVGRRTTVGINAVVLQRTTIGEGCIIAAGGVARGDVPGFSMLAGVPAEKKKELDEKSAAATEKNAIFYANNGKKFREAGNNHPNIEKFHEPGL